jgi:antitoxin component of RelBE/YafQ-DinJ toxin-antitoxin module
MGKRQICVQVDEDVAKKMEDIRDKTGIPISRQIELKLKGFKIVRDEEEPAARTNTGC